MDGVSKVSFYQNSNRFLISAFRWAMPSRCICQWLTGKYQSLCFLLLTSPFGFITLKFYPYRIS
ncbi:hypothetical protein DsansV1_C06g0067581 [Dioscorea sansibarensis]